MQREKYLDYMDIYLLLLRDRELECEGDSPLASAGLQPTD
jgi:hypothetical protein